MEPEQTTPSVESLDKFESLKKVTPLSKYLAMVLFIIMPFIGGWIGYTYAPEKIVEVEKIVVREKEPAMSESFGALNLSDRWTEGQNNDYRNNDINRTISVHPGLVTLNPGQSCGDFLKPWNYADMGNPDMGPKVIASTTDKINGYDVSLMILGDFPIDGPNIPAGIADGTITEWRTYDLCAKSQDGTKAFVITYRGGREADQDLDTALIKEIFATALD